MVFKNTEEVVKRKYLKSAYVVVISIQGMENIEGLLLRVSSEEGSEGDTESDIGLHSVWSEQAEVPTEDGTPIMGHKEHFVHTKRVNERNNVTDKVETRVGGEWRRGIGVTVASEVRGNSTVTQGTEMQNLVAP